MKYNYDDMIKKTCMEIMCTIIFWFKWIAAPVLTPIIYYLRIGSVRLTHLNVRSGSDLSFICLKMKVFVVLALVSLVAGMFIYLFFFFFAVIILQWKIETKNKH